MNPIKLEGLPQIHWIDLAGFKLKFTPNVLNSKFVYKTITSGTFDRIIAGNICI